MGCLISSPLSLEVKWPLNTAKGRILGSSESSLNGGEAKIRDVEWEVNLVSEVTRLNYDVVLREGGVEIIFRGKPTDIYFFRDIRTSL